MIWILVQLVTDNGFTISVFGVKFSNQKILFRSLILLQTWNVRFSCRTTFKESPTIRALEPDFISQFWDRVLRRVTRVNIDCFCSTIKEEKSADNCSQSFHRLEEKINKWNFTTNWRCENIYSYFKAFDWSIATNLYWLKLTLLYSFLKLSYFLEQKHWALSWVNLIMIMVKY